MYRLFIEECLRDASAMALRMAGSVAVAVKPDDVNQVVTETDLAIGELLVSRVRAEFPAYGVLEEESGALTGSEDVTWVIDPLDGTSNYAAGSPLYGVMMAVVDGSGAVLAGGIALPAFSSYYLAQKGLGATLNGSPLVTRPCGTLADRLVAFGCDKGSAEQLRAEGRRFAGVAAVAQGVRMSNSVFDIAMVASGTYAAFVHTGCRIWDVAAPACVLGESGGICTDLAGAPLDFASPLTKASTDYEVCLAAAGTPRLPGLEP